MKRLVPLALASLLMGCVSSDPSFGLDGTGGSGTGGATVPEGTGGSITPSGSGGVVGTGGMTSTGGSGTGGATVQGSGGAVFAPDGGVGTGGRTGGTDAGSADAGRNQGATGGAGGSGPVVAAVCTSNVTYTGGNGSQMRPGADCRTCHGNFTISGTVYPTAHEPNNCNGMNGNSGVRVVITGANGQVLTLTPSSAGNFYSSTAVTFPFTAMVTNGAATRTMVTAQRTGNCNSCHTQNGAQNAPGRVMAP